MNMCIKTLLQWWVSGKDDLWLFGLAIANCKIGNEAKWWDLTLECVGKQANM